MSIQNPWEEEKKFGDDEIKGLCGLLSALFILSVFIGLIEYLIFNKINWIFVFSPFLMLITLIVIFFIFFLVKGLFEYLFYKLFVGKK